MNDNQNTQRAEAKTKTKAPLSPVLDTYTVPAALEALLQADRRRAIIPAGGREQLLTALHTIVAKAAVIGLTSVTQLITEQTPMLKGLSGAETITQFHTTHVADRLHTYRNLMLTLAVAATADFRGDPTGLYQRMVKLQARTSDIRRPLTDDEVLLARFAVHTMSSLDPRSERAAVYVMVEAGMVPGETPHVTLKDVDDYEMPQHVQTPGSRHLHERFVPLDSFERSILGRFIEAAHRAAVPRTQTLTYTPNIARAKYDPKKHAPGKPAATAAAQGLLDRMLKETGIFNVDITATSIRLWRLVETYRATDAASTQELAGFGTDPKHLDRLWHVLGRFENIDQSTEDDDDITFL